MSADAMLSFLYFLIAAIIAVPLFRRLHLGSILGYLCAGIIIGPACLHLINDTQDVLHFAEIGVVLLLFVIGLELNPDKLWSMRNHIIMIGASQLLLCSLLIALIVYFVTLSLERSIIIGLALALSSTAFAIQLMVEKGVLGSSQGRLGFAILLMQDLAVIPILLVVSQLAPASAEQAPSLWLGLLAVAALLVLGRYCINPFLDVIARFGSNETMTAAALFIVIGAAFLMEEAGLSMGLGAFAAGVLLANSRYRHQLEADIEPFKGLTLGLFFIAIGMSLNLNLLVQEPLMLTAYAIGLMVIKALVITVLLVLAKQSIRKGLPIAFMLSQGGEFAFVIMTEASNSGLFSSVLAAKVNLVVGLSMMLTVPVVALLQKICWRPARDTEADDMPVNNDNSEVLILGFGRFGQMAGRILAANQIVFTALDQDPDHINFVRRFGNTVFFGNATRLELLVQAGISHAQVVLVAIDNEQQAIMITQLIREHYPSIKIVARARNRMNYLKLKAVGADVIIREVYDGSLAAAESVLSSIGYTTGQSIKAIELFRQHDKKLLEQAAKHHDNPDKLWEIGVQGRKELEQLFSEDSQNRQ